MLAGFPSLATACLVAGPCQVHGWAAPRSSPCVGNRLYSLLWPGLPLQASLLTRSQDASSSAAPVMRGTAWTSRLVGSIQPKPHVLGIQLSLSPRLPCMGSIPEASHGVRRGHSPQPGVNASVCVRAAANGCLTGQAGVGAGEGHCACPCNCRPCCHCPNQTLRKAGVGFIGRLGHLQWAWEQSTCQTRSTEACQVQCHSPHPPPTHKPNSSGTRAQAKQQHGQAVASHHGDTGPDGWLLQVALSRQAELL